MLETSPSMSGFFNGWNMNKYNIDATTTGYATKVDITDGELVARLLRAGNIRRITVTGRGNVRQIKTIAKTFYRALHNQQ